MGAALRNWLNPDASAPPDIDEAEAQLSLVVGTYAARLVLAGVVLFLSLRLLPGDGLMPGWPSFTPLTPTSSGVLSLFLLAGLTAVSSAWGIVGHVQQGRLPPESHLLLGGLQDVLWLAAGYLVSGYSAVPFLLLFVLALGVHGLLLSVGHLLVVTLLATGCFGFLIAMGKAVIGPTDPAFGARVQAVLMVGVGLLSAIVGNRLRAAGWAVRSLRRTVDRLLDYHRESLDALPVGMLVFGREEGDVQANRQARTLLGDGSLETQVAEHFPKIAEAVRCMRAGGDPGAVGRDGEARLEQGGGVRQIGWTLAVRRMPDLEKLEQSALAARLAAGGGGAAPAEPDEATQTVALVVLTDETDRRNAERLRARAERLAAINELSAGIAHEVRNPISALRLSAENLAESERADGDDRRLVSIMLRESERLDRLVEEFLEFARVGEVSRVPVPLESVVREAIEVARSDEAGEGVAAFDVDVPDVTLRCDRDLLFRVLSNLLLNAAHFTAPGTTVRVEGGQAGDAVELRVCDEGPGVPDEMRERIFSPFFTTRQTGSGLGLAVAARSASLMGGVLTVGDAPGGGACFMLTLPSARHGEGP